MKKLLKGIIFLIVILVIASIGLIYYLNSNLPVGMIRKAIIENSEKQLGRKVEVGKITGTLFKGIEISGYSVKSKSEKEEFVGIKKLYLDYEIWPLLQKKLVIKRIRLEGPVVNIVKTGEKHNFSDISEKLFSKGSDDVEKKEAFKINIDTVKIVDGQFTYKDNNGKKLAFNFIQSEIKPNDLNDISGNIKFTLDGKTSVTASFSTVIDKGSLNSNLKLGNLSLNDYWNYIVPFVPAGLKVSGKIIDLAAKVSLLEWKPVKYNAGISVKNLSIIHPKTKGPILIKESSFEIDEKTLVIDKLSFSHSGIEIDSTETKFLRADIDMIKFNKFSGDISFILDKKTSVSGSFSTILDIGKLDSDLKVKKLSVSDYWSYIAPYTPVGMKISGDTIDVDTKFSLKNWMPVKYDAEVSVKNLSIFHPKAFEPFIVKESNMKIDEKMVKVDKLIFSHSGVEMNATGKINDFLTDAPYLELAGNISTIDIIRLKTEISRYGDFPAVKALKFVGSSNIKDVKVNFKGNVRGKMKDWKYYAEAGIKVGGLEYKKDMTYKVPAFSCVVKLLENKLIIKKIAMDGLDNPGIVTVKPSGKKVIVSGELNGTANVGKLYGYVKNNGINPEKINELSGKVKFNKMIFDVTIANKVSWDFKNGFTLDNLVLKVKDVPDIVIPKGKLSGNKKKIVISDCNVMGMELGGKITNLKNLELSLKGKKTIAEILKLSSQPMPKIKPVGEIDADVTLSIDLLKGELKDFSGSIEGKLSVVPVNKGKMDAEISIKGNKNRINIKKCSIKYLDVLNGKITGHISNLTKLDLGLDLKLNKVERIFDELKKDAFRIYGDGNLDLKVKGDYKNPVVNGNLNLTKGKIFIKGTPTKEEPNPKPFIIPFDSINSPVSVNSKKVAVKPINIILCDGQLSSAFGLDFNKWPFKYDFNFKTPKPMKVEKILFENKEMQNVLNGSMTMNGKFSGNTDSVKALSGSGNAVVTKGTIQFPKSVSKFVEKIPGLEKLLYDKILCDLNINNGVMYLGKCKQSAGAKMFAKGRLFSFDGNGDLDFNSSFLNVKGTLNIMPELLKNSAYDVDKLIKNGLDQLVSLAKLVKIDLTAAGDKLKKKFETDGIPVSFAVKGKVPDELSYGMDTDSVSKYATGLIKAEGKKFIDVEKKKAMDKLKSGLLNKLLGGSKQPATPVPVTPAANSTKPAPVPASPKSLEDNLKDMLNNKLKDITGSTTESGGKIDGKDLLKNLFKF
ncbi:translocation/assembly module TamB domain-containing protein [bacterium]|nr:translocation/assembly module TamB domain-containing protein [bacterium]